MRYAEFLTHVEERAGIEREQAERAVAATLTVLSAGPGRHTIKTVFRRLSAKEDPWAGIFDDARPLPK